MIDYGRFANPMNVSEYGGKRRPGGRDRPEVFVTAFDTKGKELGYARAVYGPAGRVRTNESLDLRGVPARTQIAYVTGAEAYRQHRGTGSLVVKRLLSELRRRGAKFVYLHADNSQGFWERHGFHVLDCGEAVFDDVPCMRRAL